MPDETGEPDESSEGSSESRFWQEWMRHSVRRGPTPMVDRAALMREAVRASRPLDRTTRMRDAINRTGKITFHGKLLRHLKLGTIDGSALSPSLLRRASESLSSMPIADVAAAWEEALSGAERSPATDSAVARLQLSVPSLPPQVARWIVMSFVWLVVLGLLSTWTSEHSETAKDVNDLYGLNPTVVATALAIWSGRAAKRWQGPYEEG